MSGGSGALSLVCFSPAGVIAKPAAVRLAVRRLRALGFDATIDDAALARSQRFAGDDATRLASIHRIARAAPSVALATRGGYGLTRLLDGIDWKLVADSVERGTRWVGQSDLTSLQLGLIAHTRGAAPVSWAGPLAADHFGRSDADGGVDEVTRDAFREAMSGELEAIGFRTEPGFDGLDVKGTLWGGNLTVLLSLMGTPHWPGIKGGILFLEDVNEHPYRIERGLLQLHQAGVLGAQKAIVLGHFTAWKPSPLDRGFTLKSVVAHLRGVCKTPILTGLPVGHVPTLVPLPVGARATLATQGREAFIGW
ncbi:MAG TPA: LD-carboxypeptidase [Burkholderiaceae bacterium]|nr:LD-carboxypeptidase [Burkholderiaceae bacterium]